MGVITREALTTAVKTNFWKSFRQNESGAKEFLKYFCLFTNSKGRTDVEVYPTSLPHLKYYAPGQGVPEDGYGEESFSFTTYDFGVDISWFERDREDQQVEIIQQKGTDAGLATAVLHERILAQLVKAEENTDLLPGISGFKAPDGVSPFSTTDGNGDDRYGVADGNLQGLTDFTLAGVEDDLFTLGIPTFSLFKHTHLKTKIFTPQMLKRFLIVIPPEKFKVFAKLLFQEYQEATAGSQSGLVQGIKSRGYEFDLFVWPELEGEETWFLVAKDAPVLPFITSETRGIQIDPWDAKNSDSGRKGRREGVTITRRDKWGIGPCFGMIKFA